MATQEIKPVLARVYNLLTTTDFCMVWIPTRWVYYEARDKLRSLNKNTRRALMFGKVRRLNGDLFCEDRFRVRIGIDWEHMRLGSGENDRTIALLNTYATVIGTPVITNYTCLNGNEGLRLLKGLKLSSRYIPTIYRFASPTSTHLGHESFYIARKLDPLFRAHNFNCQVYRKPLPEIDDE